MDRAPQYVDHLMQQLESGLRSVGISAKAEWEPVGGGTRLYRIWVTARKFREMGYSERQSLVWRIAEKALPDNRLVHVSMILTLTPDEAKDAD